jgi:hypothetical protein
VLGAGLAVVACQDAVNLSVKYNELIPDGGTGTGAVDASLELPPGNELQACPCDQTQGLACCVSSVGPAFCTTDKDRCDGENGAFYRCFGPDPNTDSLCCWHGSGARATTAYAATCDAGPRACIRSTDCAPGVDCLLTDCAGTRIGACGTLPTCPPGTAH